MKNSNSITTTASRKVKDKVVVKTKSNRNHSPGHVSPNTYRLTVHYINTEGKKDFVTTRTFKDVKTYDEAMLLIDNISDVRLAFWNNRLIAKDGQLI